VQEEWSRKGATLSDKTARKEFGLTQDEIVAAIDAGQQEHAAPSRTTPHLASHLPAARET